MINVLVTSAVALTSTQTEKIQKAVSKKYGKDVTFTYMVKPEILGGIILTIDSRQLDASMKSKLERVKEELNQKIMSE